MVEQVHEHEIVKEVAKPKSEYEPICDFKTKLQNQLHSSEVFCTRFNYDGSLLANTYMDGSLYIVNPLLGDKIRVFHEKDMTLPITRMVWKHVYQFD